LFFSIDAAIVFMIVVLPALGGDTMMPRWPLPIGILEAQVRVREQRREVLEPRAAPGLFGVGPVDGEHLEQGRVLLVAPRGTAGAGDVVALAQAVLAGELHRDVGVVAARQVPLHAKEAVALVAHVEVARHRDRFVADRLLLLLGFGIDASIDDGGVVTLRAVRAAATLATTATATVA
jgi:hypothetical protein